MLISLFWKSQKSQYGVYLRQHIGRYWYLWYDIWHHWIRQLNGGKLNAVLSLPFATDPVARPPLFAFPFFFNGGGETKTSARRWRISPSFLDRAAPLTARPALSYFLTFPFSKHVARRRKKFLHALSIFAYVRQLSMRGRVAEHYYT